MNFKHLVVFIESDFDLKIQDSLVIRSPFKWHNKFRRLIVNLYYILYLLFLPRKSTIVAPWGLFWIPAIWKKIGIKKFKIISLSCDTFLSEKTINNQKNGIIQKIKFRIAQCTHFLVDYFICCSDVVSQQVIKFGVSPEKCIFKYREWVRNEDRYNKFQLINPSLSTNNYIFIGYCYSLMQKRADLLVDAFLLSKKDGCKSTLTIIGYGWANFFGQEKLKKLAKNGIFVVGEINDLEYYFKSSAFYIHPGEFEGFGIAVLESMLAGLIPLVSDKTGAIEAVSQINLNLVFPLDVLLMAEKINWANKLDLSTRIKLSQKAKEIAKTYKKENSVPDLRKKLINFL